MLAPAGTIYPKLPPGNNGCTQPQGVPQKGKWWRGLEKECGALGQRVYVQEEIYGVPSMGCGVGGGVDLQNSEHGRRAGWPVEACRQLVGGRMRGAHAHGRAPSAI